MTDTDTPSHAHVGLAAFIFGIIAIVIAGIVVSGQFNPPTQSAGQSIGELAAEIRESAQRALRGEDAPVAPPPAMRIVDYLTIAIPLVAGVAAILGAISIFRKEPTRLGKYAIFCGVGAVLLHYVFMLALLMCGIFLVVAVIQNMDGILGG